MSPLREGEVLQASRRRRLWSFKMGSEEGPAGQRPGKVGWLRSAGNQGRGLGARQEVSHSCRAEVTGLIPRPSGKGERRDHPHQGNPSRPFFPVLPPA